MKIEHIQHWIKKHTIITENASHNKSLWAISFMSYFGGTASVMVFSILSIFMTEELHLSYKHVGYIEGIAVAFAFITKIISGVISDRLKRRKLIIVIGTIFSVIIKPMFALAGGLYWIFAAKSLDRIAKGIRSAPTEALVGDLSAHNKEGISYGTRYAFYALGFMSGGAIASLIMHFSHNNFRLVFWLSLIPATLSLITLCIFVKDPIAHLHRQHESTPNVWKIKDIKQLPSSFWHLMVVAFLLMLARFSDAFLHYRGRELGFAIASVPFLMILYNFIEAIAPVPIGRLADKMNRKTVFLWGILTLLFANLIAIVFPYKQSVLISITLAGLHMGMTQGLLGTLIASSVPTTLRGTGFAIFYLVVGIAAPFGNFMAGHLSEFSKSLGHGVIGAFIWGLLATCLSSLYLVIWIQKQHIIKTNQ